MENRFHLALACKSKVETQKFYNKILGFKIGREGDNWVDVNMNGNQVTFKEDPNFNVKTPTYKLGEHQLPVFHFGVILELSEWSFIYQSLYDRGLELSVEKEFFINQIGEHTSFFVTDPNGYGIEFKYFKNSSDVFKKIK